MEVVSMERTPMERVPPPARFSKGAGHRPGGGRPRLRPLVLALVVPLVLAGCKPPPPALPIPESSASTGVPAPCEDLVPGGFPRVVPQVDGTYFLCREGEFVLNSNPSRKTAQWVSERLTAQALSAPPTAQTAALDVRPDPTVAAIDGAKLKDYVGTGYVLDFLATPNDFRSNDVAFSHAHYLTNAVPLHPAAVAPWAAVTALTRAIAAQRGTVFVVSGPVYAGGQGLGWVGVPDHEHGAGPDANKGKIEVPTHLFRVIVDPSTHQALAFLLPNGPAAAQGTVTNFIVPVGVLEQTATLRLAPDWSDAERAALHAPPDPAAWLPPSVLAAANAHIADDAHPPQVPQPKPPAGS